MQSGHLLREVGGEGELGAVGGVGASRHQEYEFIMYLTQFC